MTFQAVHRFYDPTTGTWTVRSCLKDVPLAQLDVLADGSIERYVQLGLFDAMETETVPGSRADVFHDSVRRRRC